MLFRKKRRAENKIHVPRHMNTPLAELDGYNSLVELALDLRWSWNHETDVLWNHLDPFLWDLTRNPWAILQTVSFDKLQSFLSNPAFRRQVDDLVGKKNSADSNAWFQKNHPQSPLTSVAYFSMEFMLSEALPIYSGGLGNVAGEIRLPPTRGRQRGLRRAVYKMEAGAPRKVAIPALWRSND
jgi:hypothetical protein